LKRREGVFRNSCTAKSAAPYQQNCFILIVTCTILFYWSLDHVIKAVSWKSNLRSQGISLFLVVSPLRNLPGCGMRTRAAPFECLLRFVTCAAVASLAHCLTQPQERERSAVGTTCIYVRLPELISKRLSMVEPAASSARWWDTSLYSGLHPMDTRHSYSKEPQLGKRYGELDMPHRQGVSTLLVNQQRMDPSAGSICWADTPAWLSQCLFLVTCRPCCIPGGL
jgi:hypothetical protein